MRKAYLLLVCSLFIAVGVFLFPIPQAHAATSSFSHANQIPIPGVRAGNALNQSGQVSDGENDLLVHWSITPTSANCLVASASASTQATDGHPFADIAIAGILFENGKAIDSIQTSAPDTISAFGATSCNPIHANAVYSLSLLVDAQFTDDGDVIEFTL